MSSADWNEKVCCKLCARVGTIKSMRSGYQDGTWICIVRRSCNRRIRIRRAGGTPWRGLSKTQADAMAFLYQNMTVTPWQAHKAGISTASLDSLVKWRLAHRPRVSGITTWKSIGAWWH